MTQRRSERSWTVGREPVHCLERASWVLKGAAATSRMAVGPRVGPDAVLRRSLPYGRPWVGGGGGGWQGRVRG